VYGFGKGVYRTAFPPPAASQPEVSPMRDAGHKLTDASLQAAKTAVELCIVLIGLMALWLGMMNIAKEAGMVDALARALRPVTRWLFPDVPAGHSAEGAMLMNISANLLGLGNAATPFGLKAMRELQTLNPTPDTATNSMSTFLAINTSGFTLIPFTIIGLRVASQSASATRPLAGIIMASMVSTVVAILATRWLSRRSRYAMAATRVNADTHSAQQMEN
jgi:spore maturation protein A